MLRSFSYTFVGFMAVVVAFLFLDSFPGGSGAKPQLVKADFTSISSALDSYRKITGDYPTTNEGLMALVTRPETLPEEHDWQAIFTKVPTDPWKNEYRYRRLLDSSPRPFELRCVGPDGIEGNEDDRVSE